VYFYLPPPDQTSTKHGSRHEGKPSKLQFSDSHSSHTRKAKPSTRTSDYSNVNFLFVVNELNMNQDHPPSADRWGNYTPPDTPNGYVHESVGRVFRYHDGIITPEEKHMWYRSDVGERGDIGYWTQEADEAGNALPLFNALATYSTFAVFNCGPFLPLVYGVGDVSEDHSDFDGWRALHFHHVSGVSQASPNGGHKCLAGRNTDFIDRLVPRAYCNSEARAPQSKGLGGEIGLVIGMMALSQSPGMIDTAFHSQAWAGNKWTAERAADACMPSLRSIPRKMVCTDLYHRANFCAGTKGRASACGT
jgi:hypothetical protein